MRTPSRTSFGALITLIISLAVAGPAAASPPPESDDWPRWRWPLAGSHSVAAPFRAPAHAYGAGHRGIDLDGSSGSVVVAPEDGVVAFRGTVVDRPLLTIEHAGGLVSTFEPLDSDLVPGDPIATGQEIGLVAVGGHSPAGALHVGVRHNGDYINPLLLFGDVPRAILLPCCAG